MPDRGPPAARLALSDPSLAAGQTGRGGWGPIGKEWLPMSEDRPRRLRSAQGAVSALGPRGAAGCGRADDGASRSEGSAWGRRNRGRRRRGPRRAPGKSYDRLNGAAVAGHAPYPPGWGRGRRALHKLAQGRLRSAVPSPSDCTPERRVRRGRDSLSRATPRHVPEAPAWTRVRRGRTRPHGSAPRSPTIRAAVRRRAARGGPAPTVGHRSCRGPSLRSAIQRRPLVLEGSGGRRRLPFRRASRRTAIQRATLAWDG